LDELKKNKSKKFNRGTRKMETDWKTELSYKLSVGLLILTIVISLVDLLYPPIFVNETISSKAQVIGQDLVNLLFGVPALDISMRKARKGNLKARLIWLGILAYFAYTFLSYGVLFKLNPGFLLYTAGFGLSLYATLLNLGGIEFEKLVIKTNNKTRNNAQYIICFIIILIVLLWSPSIVSYYLYDQMPTSVTQDGFHTLIIPFQDFSILLPLAALTIWLVRKDEALGYIIVPVILIKTFSIAIAVLGMIVFMHLSGVPAILSQVLIFTIASLALGLYERSYLANIEIKRIQSTSD
jgi:hypothetical protein